MRTIVLLAVALLVALPGAAGGATPKTELKITVWPRGTKISPYRFTLECGPTDGTLPKRRVACSRLARLSRPFAPVPKGVSCSELFGGPAVALVTGHVGSRKIWARFDRTDSCRIGRWEKHAFLFGGIRIASG